MSKSCDVPQILVDFWHSFTTNDIDRALEALEKTFSRDLVFVDSNKISDYDGMVEVLKSLIVPAYSFEYVTPTGKGFYDALPTNYLTFGTLKTIFEVKETGERFQTDARFTGMLAPREGGTKVYYMQLSPNAKVIPEPIGPK